jgi:hypothetical protein
MYQYFVLSLRIVLHLFSCTMMHCMLIYCQCLMEFTLVSALVTVIYIFSFELNELVSHNVVVVCMILYMRIFVLMGCVFFKIKKKKNGVILVYNEYVIGR